MSQYFENDPKLASKITEMTFDFDGRTYHLRTDAGVFSKDRLDTGTRILLETVIAHQSEPCSVLDMGCGIGPVSVILSHYWNSAFTMIDINQRAVDRAAENIQRYHLQANLLCQDGITAGQFDCIVFNPPIRTGKQTIYRLFDECLEHLNGTLWIVMRKQHGAASALKFFEEKGLEVHRVRRDKGYWVLQIFK